MKKTTLLLLLAGALFLNAMKAEEKSAYMARFLVSITRYIEWPSTMKSGDFKIGVVGDFKVYKAIAEETMGAGIHHRNVDIMNLPKIEHAGITDLNILILTENLSTPANIAKANKIIGNKPTLLVTERSGALSYGSGINFIEINNKIGFEINKSNASKNGIRVNSQIDVFATRVEK